MFLDLELHETWIELLIFRKYTFMSKLDILMDYVTERERVIDSVLHVTTNSLYSNC